MIHEVEHFGQRLDVRAGDVVAARGGDVRLVRFYRANEGGGPHAETMAEVYVQRPPLPEQVVLGEADDGRPLPELLHLLVDRRLGVSDLAEYLAGREFRAKSAGLPPPARSGAAGTHPLDPPPDDRPDPEA